MRILHVVPTYLPATRYGGPIYSVHGLCKALASSGHDVHVITTNVDGAGDSDVPLGMPVLLDGVHVWYFPSKRLRRLYWSPRMMRALKTQVPQCDVVHLHSVFLWPTWAAARVARACGTPYVLSPRGMLVRGLIRRKSRWLKSAWIRMIESPNLSNAAAIHVTSKRERKDLEELGLALSRVHIVPNGVDLEDCSPEMHLDPELEAVLTKGPSALYLGRLSWKKGLDRLIRAWKQVRQGHLLVAGNDDENLAPKLIRLIGETGLQDRVTLVARHINDKEKRALFGRARVAVLPSYSENFGNVVIEAMAAGCPVVVTPEVGAADVVLKAGGGLVAEADALAASLDRLLGNEAEASEMGRSGREYVTANYSWHSVGAAISDLYRDAVTKG